MSAPHPVIFGGGATGAWRVDRVSAVVGAPLPAVQRLAVDEGAGATWTLRGITGHHRYVERAEQAALQAVSPALGRPAATRAALIPIRKSDAWWELPQDERRAILEDQSHHIALGLKYLPASARRLYHCRELGEPFDFLTWFEYAPEHASLFEELVLALRATNEWTYVEREVDIRLSG